MRQALGVILLLVVGSAQAAPVTWTIDSMLFDDGGTGSGSFVYDANTNTYSAISIVTTAGSQHGGATYNFINPSAPGGIGGFGTVAADIPDLTGVAALAMAFDSPLSNGEGTRGFFFGFEAVCSDAVCTAPADPQRNLLSGQISAVPIPAAVWLFGSGLGLLGWMRRKKTA